MHFKVVYGNHWNFGIQVSETMRLIKASLESIGHRADIERNFCPGYINILQEGFKDEYVEQVEDALKTPGTRIIIIGSEFLTEDTFNNFTNQGNSSSYSDQAYWRHRFENFLKLEKHSVAVWHLGEHAIDAYGKYLQHDKVLYFPHYYVSGMQTVKHYSDQEKDVDFLFTGTPTEYRKEILTELEKHGARVLVERELTASFHRESLLQRSKIALNIRQYPNWQHPSPSRFHYHIINQSLLVTEKCDYDADIQNYVLTAPADNFVEFCMNVLEDGQYNRKAEDLKLAFKRQCPMEPVIEKLLADSF